ncbi:hypothetical protein DSO57_1012630 [Entomophthora muscae]|uniref:Uncharacterized protein n=1 Tax=Entomophthora muscae TaxID=34485 RepID=A0ACC2S7W1_9FUNG|nr:hypothetical protein DSO57_1012630 [Entomophthora muscae]
MGLSSVYHLLDVQQALYRGTLNCCRGLFIPPQGIDTFLSLKNPSYFVWCTFHKCTLGRPGSDWHAVRGSWVPKIEGQVCSTGSACSITRSGSDLISGPYPGRDRRDGILVGSGELVIELSRWYGRGNPQPTSR